MNRKYFSSNCQINSREVKLDEGVGYWPGKRDFVVIAERMVMIPELLVHGHT